MNLQLVPEQATDRWMLQTLGEGLEQLLADAKQAEAQQLTAFHCNVPIARYHAGEVDAYDHTLSTIRSILA